MISLLHSNKSKYVPSIVLNQKVLFWGERGRRLIIEHLSLADALCHGRAAKVLVGEECRKQGSNGPRQVDDHEKKKDSCCLLDHELITLTHTHRETEKRGRERE